MDDKRNERTDDRSGRRVDEPGTPQASAVSSRHIHERQDVNSKSLIISIVTILIILGIIHVIVAGMVLLFLAYQRKVNPPPPALATLNPPPPEPRLQSNPPADMTRMLDEQTRILNSYGWVDQKAGIARIPIERAMDIVARQGMPPKQANANTTLGTQIIMHRKP
jgi:hypothetical protein